MGRAQVPANSPIKIKKHVRAPGNRKMLKSFKKLEGNVVRMVNEFRSSRMCGRCFGPFALRTLSHRFKVCYWCWPNQNEWPDGLKLPRRIITMKSKRMLKWERRQLRDAMVENPNLVADGFVSKMICYRKNWQQNAAHNVDNNQNADCMEVDEDEDEPGPPISNVVWQRDITAAKLIMYRGMIDRKTILLAIIIICIFCSICRPL